MKTVALAFSLFLLGTTPQEESIELFNGKDVTGWTADLKDGGKMEDVWSVKDGILCCTGKPGGVIRTKESFSNYELTVEWRWPDRGGNSGVLVHCSDPQTLKIWPKSQEVQLHSGNAGDFWVIGEDIKTENMEKRRKGRNIKNLTDDSEKPIGEWNQMKIVCKGDEIIVHVNGDLVNHGTESTASEGAICLQSEGTPVQFRKVSLKKLK